MTTVPDWLVERAALAEVPPASAARLAAADPAELAAKTAAIAEATARELAHHPAGPAVAQIEARAAAARRTASGKRRRIGLGAGVLAAAAVTAIVVVGTHAGGDAHDGTRIAAIVPPPPTWPRAHPDDLEITRAKGAARLVVYRNAGERAERLDPDAVARAGDVLQLRYDGGGRRYGVIASVDGAGAVTLHYPADERATTALAERATALPAAYALDDAPRFERFFFVTANEPIDVGATLDTLRTFAHRGDADTADLDLPSAFQQWSLRLRKAGSP